MTTINIKWERFSGFVIKCPDTRHALVEYEEIGQQTVATRFVVPISGAIARPPIRVSSTHMMAKCGIKMAGINVFAPIVLF